MAEQLNEFAFVINDWATKKGWNEDPIADIPMPESVRARIELALKAEQHMLFVTELAESMEALRTKTPDGAPYMDDKVPALTGVEAELADTLIRIFHYAGKHGLDLGRAVQLKHEYNTKRPYRHGKHC